MFRSSEVADRIFRSGRFYPQPQVSFSDRNALFVSAEGRPLPGTEITADVDNRLFGLVPVPSFTCSFRLPYPGRDTPLPACGGAGTVLKAGSRRFLLSYRRIGWPFVECMFVPGPDTGRTFHPCDFPFDRELAGFYI